MGTNAHDMPIHEIVSSLGCRPDEILIAKNNPEAKPRSMALPKKNAAIQTQMNMILLTIIVP
jgi:hypothetical protein